MEDNELGQHFWNFLTKPKSKASYEETEQVEGTGIDTQSPNENEGGEADEGTDDEVQDGIDAGFHNDSHSQGVTADHSFIEVPQGIASFSYSAHTDYPYIEVPQGMTAYSCTAQRLPADSYNTEDDTGDQDYGPFVEATEEGNWSIMRELLNSHPQALTAPWFYNGGTALHHSLRSGKDREEIAACLVERMTPDDLEIKDEDGYTPLARAAYYHHPMLLMQRMIEKNTNLPNIGDVYRLPVAVASWKGFKDTTRFLYNVTHNNIFSPEYVDGAVGVNLLRDCINIKLFDIASELVEKFPKILLQRYIYEEESIYPIHAFAIKFSAFTNSEGGLSKKSSFADHILKYLCHFLGGLGVKNTSQDDEESADNIDRARDFLRLICRNLSNFNVNTLTECVGEAMIEAAKHGNIEFITEMLRVDSELIKAENKDGKDMFWHAVENRQEKVFNLIYGVGDDHKDPLLSHVNREKNNILHCAAMLPHLSILDRILSPPLQMQRELQWFKEVSNVAKTRYRGNLNKDKLTPRQLFTEQHKELVDWAEASMKDTAKAATTVGALIITTMFAAAFAVTSGNNQIIPNNSSFTLTEALFNVFIVCDALSLCSSTTAILVFLEILTSRYSEEDFLFRLPRKFMVGFYTLFTAIATMMTAFCSALAIALQGRLLLIIVLILVFLFVPVMFAMSSIFPLLRVACISTYGPSIFDKSTKLPESRRGSIGCCY